MKCFRCGSVKLQEITLQDTIDYKNAVGLLFSFNVDECTSCGSRQSYPKLKKKEIMAIKAAYKTRGNEHA